MTACFFSPLAVAYLEPHLGQLILVSGLLPDASPVTLKLGAAVVTTLSTVVDKDTLEISTLVETTISPIISKEPRDERACKSSVEKLYDPTTDEASSRSIEVSAAGMSEVGCKSPEATSVSAASTGTSMMDVSQLVSNRATARG